jgi:integrase
VDGLQSTTITNHTWVADYFARKFGLLNRPVNAVTADYVIEAVNGDNGKRLSTRIFHLNSLRKFLEWCSAKGYCMGNAARVIRRVNSRALPIALKEPRYKKPWPQADVDKMLGYFDRRMLKIEARMKLIQPSDGGTVANIQMELIRDRWRQCFAWKCAVILARYAGLRLGDCMKLEWDSILPSEMNQDGKHLLVYTHKKDRRLSIPMPPEIAELIPQMIAQRNDNRYVFRGMARRYDTKFGQKGLTSGFCKFAMLLGLPHGRNFHSLRVTYAYACRDAGMPTENISRLLTHLDAETTALYLGGPGPKYPSHFPPGYAAVPPAAAPATQTALQNEQE